MKRTLTLILSLLYLLCTFIGCQSATTNISPPNTISILIEEDAHGFQYALEEKIESLYGDNISIEYICIPSASFDNLEERSAFIQQIKTEIIAGKGPDLFYLPTKTSSGNEGFFGNIYTTIQSGVFLPLDEYIDNSEYINPEDYVPSIYTEGRSTEGQVVIPVLYSQNLILIDKSMLSNKDASIHSMNDIINSNEDAIIAKSYAYLDNWAINLLPEMVDTNNNLLVDKKDFSHLFENLLSMSNHTKTINNGDQYVLDRLYNRFDEGMLYNYCADKEDLYPLMITRADGSESAKITGIAAINRNTTCPDKAFKVLELLCGYTKHSISALRPSVNSMAASQGISSGINHYGEKDLIDSDFINELQNHISDARFETSMDSEIIEAYREYALLSLSESSTDYGPTIDNLISRLKMIIAE